MSSSAVTLSRHILNEEEKHSEITVELSKLVAQLGYAAKILSREIGRAALTGNLGFAGDKNATGDTQKKLDVYTNDIVVKAFGETKLVAGIVSEELEEVKVLSCESRASYILCIDPLDGSSNTDINGSVGTIFGVYRRRMTNGCDLHEELRQRASEQVAAGYVMYGTSTVMVYTCGHGVHGFTLDRELGEFVLTHENIRCPAQGRYYSANMSRLDEWPVQIQGLIKYLNERDPVTKRPYSLRYAGALVADLHRSLMEGGLYFYPADADHRNGKLRFLYECAPLAFVVEQAGGRASTGEQRILDLQGDSIHQRVPLVIGSADDVELYERFLRNGSGITHA